MTPQPHLLGNQALGWGRQHELWQLQDSGHALLWMRRDAGQLFVWVEEGASSRWPNHVDASGVQPSRSWSAGLSRSNKWLDSPRHGNRSSSPTAAIDPSTALQPSGDVERPVGMAVNAERARVQWY